MVSKMSKHCQYGAKIRVSEANRVSRGRQEGDDNVSRGCQEQ